MVKKKKYQTTLKIYGRDSDFIIDDVLTKYLFWRIDQGKSTLTSDQIKRFIELIRDGKGEGEPWTVSKEDREVIKERVGLTTAQYYTIFSKLRGAGLLEKRYGELRLSERGLNFLERVASQLRALMGFKR